ELNQGQAEPDVKLLGRGHGYNVLFKSAETVLIPISSRATASRTPIRMSLTGANPEARVEGLDRLPETLHVIRGKDPNAWRTDVPSYARVRYYDVYPGVDVVYYGAGQHLEYDFVLKAGVDPDVITVQLDGIDALEIDGDGTLVLNTATGEIRQPKPI